MGEGGVSSSSLLFPGASGDVYSSGVDETEFSHREKFEISNKNFGTVVPVILSLVTGTRGGNP